MNLINIIREEVLKFISEAYNSENMSINDVATIAGDKAGYSDQPQAMEYFIKIFLDEYKAGGDDAVIKQFKESTGVDIFSIRNGRYSFRPQVTPDNYQWNKFANENIIKA